MREKASLPETTFHDTVARLLPDGMEAPRSLNPVLHVCRHIENPSELFDILSGIKGIDEQELVRGLVDASVRSILHNDPAIRDQARQRIQGAPGSEQVPAPIAGSPLSLEGVAAIPEKDHEPDHAQGKPVIRIFHAPKKKVFACIAELPDGRARILPGAKISRIEQKTMQASVRQKRDAIIPPASDTSETEWISDRAVDCDNVRMAVNFCLGGILSGLVHIPTEEEYVASKTSEKTNETRQQGVLEFDKLENVTISSLDDHKIRSLEKTIRETALKSVLPFGGNQGRNIWMEPGEMTIVYSSTRSNPNHLARFCISWAKLYQALLAHVDGKRAAIMLIHYKLYGFACLSISDFEFLVGQSAKDLIDTYECFEAENGSDAAEFTLTMRRTAEDSVRICRENGDNGVSATFRVLKQECRIEQGDEQA